MPTVVQGASYQACEETSLLSCKDGDTEVWSVALPCDWDLHK